MRGAENKNKKKKQQQEQKKKKKNRKMWRRGNQRKNNKKITETSALLDRENMKINSVEATNTKKKEEKEEEVSVCVFTFYSVFRQSIMYSRVSLYIVMMMKGSGDYSLMCCWSQ